ncbi:MAG TPA: hypothetical protein VIK56_01375, partial [Rhodoferax sp.]
MSIDEHANKIYPAFSINVGRRKFIEVSAGAIASFSLSSLLSGCGGGDGGGSSGTQVPEVYPISSDVYTTRQRT